MMIPEGEVEPPHENKKTTDSSSLPPRYSSWFSSLPHEIAMNCLTRLPKSHYHSLSLVSKHFSSLISAPELYAGNSRMGSLLYICLQSPDHPSPRWFSLWLNFPRLNPGNLLISTYFSKIRKCPKQNMRNMSQDVHNQLILSWNSINLKPNLSGKNQLIPTWYLSDSLPASVSTVAVGTDIYAIGGYITPSSTIKIFDCRTHTWRNGPNMNVSRVEPMTSVIDDEIYVMGGCGSDMSTVWTEVLNTKTQTWRVIPSTLNTRYMMNRVDELCRCWWLIENVMYSFTNAGEFMWYDSVGDRWRYVKGLEMLFRDWNINKKYLIDIVNYGGRFALMYEEKLVMSSASSKKVIWYAMVTIERDERGEICGKIDWVHDVFYVPKLYKILRCLAIPV